MLWHTLPPRHVTLWIRLVAADPVVRYSGTRNQHTGWHTVKHHSLVEGFDLDVTSMFKSTVVCSACMCRVYRLARNKRLKADSLVCSAAEGVHLASPLANLSTPSDLWLVVLLLSGCSGCG